MDVLAFVERPQEATLRTVALVTLTGSYPPQLGARAVAAVSRAAAAPTVQGDPTAATASAAAYHR